MTPTAQHAAQDALERLGSALDDLLTLPLGTLDRDDVDHAVRAAYALGNRLDAAKLRLVRAALDRTTDGTVTDLLATHPVNLSRPQARKDVAAARHTDPDVLDAGGWDGRIGGLRGDRGSLARLGAQLTAGNTTLAHVHAAVSALRSIPTPLRRGTVAVQVETGSGDLVWTEHHRSDLIDGFFSAVAATQPLGTTRQLIDDVLVSLDPDRCDRHTPDLEPDATSRRALTFTRHHGLLRMTVDLDEHAAVIVRAAVDAASRPDPTTGGNGDNASEPDTRSTMQRRHDGLVHLVTTGAHHPASDLDPVITHKATVVLRATLTHDGGIDTSTATVDGHGPVSQATVRAATCDADVSVAVMDRLGRPRSLHTLDRHATPAQRLLVAERDRGCTAPGCGAPAWACHYHHVIHWSDGGTHQHREPDPAPRPAPPGPARRTTRSPLRRGRPPGNPHPAPPPRPARRPRPVDPQRPPRTARQGPGARARPPPGRPAPPHGRLSGRVPNG